MMTDEILEARARELARRGTEKDKENKASFLVAEWPERSFGFEPALFNRLLETDASPCPSGVTFRGLPCSGFIYYRGLVYPVVPWSELAGLDPPEMPVYAVTENLGMALELAGPCRIEKVDPNGAKEVDRPYCRKKVGELYLADLSVLG